MLRKTGFALTAVVLAFGASPPALAQTAYEQCLIDYCFGNYENDPVGYKMCREWCARQTGGPQFAPAAVDPVKLD